MDVVLFPTMVGNASALCDVGHTKDKGSCSSEGQQLALGAEQISGDAGLCPSRPAVLTLIIAIVDALCCFLLIAVALTFPGEKQPTSVYSSQMGTNTLKYNF